MEEIIAEIVGEIVEFGAEAIASAVKKKRQAKRTAQEELENSEDEYFKKKVKPKKHRMSLSTRIMRRKAIKLAKHE